MVVVSLAFNPPRSLLSLYIPLPLSPSPLSPSLIFPFPGHHIFVYVTHLLSLYSSVSHTSSSSLHPLSSLFSLPPSLTHPFFPFSFPLPHFFIFPPSLPAFPPSSSFPLFLLPSFPKFTCTCTFPYLIPSFPLPQVVAPVRATCAQVLGIVCHQLEASRVGGVIDTLLTLVRQDMWEVRHAALMGIQHLLASRMVYNVYVHVYLYCYVQYIYMYTDCILIFCLRFVYCSNCT